MKRLLFSLLIFLPFALLHGQTTFTQRVQQKVGTGSIVIHQSKAIDNVVNNVNTSSTMPVTHTATAADTTAGAVHRVKAEGYRIQVFTGGNSRQDRQNAERMKSRCENLFPELQGYAHFESPRWICRVGDFCTEAEAQPYLEQIRKSNVSNEARVVRCTVMLPAQ